MQTGGRMRRFLVVEGKEMKLGRLLVAAVVVVNREGKGLLWWTRKCGVCGVG